MNSVPIISDYCVDDPYVKPVGRVTSIHNSSNINIGEFYDNDDNFIKYITQLYFQHCRLFSNSPHNSSIINENEITNLYNVVNNFLKFFFYNNY